VVGACLLVGTIAMIATLFRILDNRYPAEDADAYYARTLRLLSLPVSSGPAICKAWRMNLGQLPKA